MRIAIPVEKAEGLASIVFGHFGSAPQFIVYDTDSQKAETVDNGNAHHDHGMCQPLSQLSDKRIDVVVSGGMGKRAVAKLNESGIKVFRAASTGITVQDILNQYESGQLAELTAENACGGHHSCH